MSKATEQHPKLALITGASRGLGRHLARACAQRGYRLALVARKQEELEQLADELSREHDCDAAAFAFDLAEKGAATRCANEVSTVMGPVDVLVNNAGIGWYKPLLEHATAELDGMIELNFTAMVHLTRALLPAMLERGKGLVVNIASDLSHRPLANMSVYTATKYAMRGFSLSLSGEVRRQGVKVVLVNPGMIDTFFHGRSEGSLEEAGALKSAPLSDLILQVMEQPGHQMVDEITVHATFQDY